MLRIEELEALDLVVWLRSSTAAAALAGTNQSTISRRARRALELFQAELRRDRQAWRVQTPLAAVLHLQRQVHQQWRLRSGRGLRLQVPPWSRAAVRSCLLPGWEITPADGPQRCETPLELLRDHVIEACLLTPTQLAGQPMDDLVLFDLYGSRIDLHLVASAGPQDPAEHSPQAAAALLLQGRLQPLPFLPGSCTLSSQQRFAQLRRELDPPADGSAEGAWRLPIEAPQLAFLTPVMAAGLAGLRPLPLPLEWPYRESLVMLRSVADQPALQALVERLSCELPPTLQRLVPGGVAAIV